ncbi:MAG: mechanosensitive ion channel family protein [Caulobacteraceae bacterium]
MAAAPASPPAIPPLPKSIVHDIATGNLDDAVTRHQKLWETYGHDISNFAVSLLVALVILVVTFWAAGWGAGLTKRAIGRMHSRNGGADVTLQSFMGSLTRYAIIIVGLVMVLQQLGVKTTSVLAVLSGLLLGIGLALQGALSNVAAGVMLLLFRPYRVGDLVEVGGRMGTVQSLDLMVTEMKTPDNLRIVAPNGKIFGDFIVNYTKPNRRRVDVTFHIPPNRDLAAVLEAMRAQLAADKRVLKDPAPSFEANGLNELYAEGIIRVWAKATDYVAVKTAIVLGVQKLTLAPAE